MATRPASKLNLQEFGLQDEVELVDKQARQSIENIIDDTATSTDSTYSSSKIETELSSIEDEVDAIIDDTTTASTSTWSSEKINDEFEDVVSTKTVSGNPVTFTDGASAPLVKCVTQITGSQDLHGYDKPWVGGAGVNKYEGSPSFDGYTNLSYWTLDSTTHNGHEVYKRDGSWQGVYKEITLPVGTYTFSLMAKTDGSISANIYIGGNATVSVDTKAVTPTSTWGKYSLTFDVTTAGTIWARIEKESGNGYLFISEYQMEQGSTATTFAPYSNICPITAYTEGEIEVSDGDGNTTTHTTTFPSAIYRGSEDCVNGSVETEKKKIKFSDLTWEYDSTNIQFVSSEISDAKSGTGWDTNLISSHYEVNSANYATMNTPHVRGIQTQYKKLYVVDARYSTAADFLLSMGDAEVVYELATPTTSSVTPTNLPIKSLSGYTHIESTTGEMEVEYITEEFQPLVDLIQSNKHVYSTAEQIVGTWIDGKTVYEKTIDFGYLPNNTTKDVAHNISNIDKIWISEGFVYGTNGMCTLVNLPNDNSPSQWNCFVNNTYIEFWAGSDRTDRYAYVVVRYTKTTPTRSLNLTKSAVEEIPDEIKNAPFEEKPDYNEADDDAPTEVDER